MDTNMLPSTIHAVDALLVASGIWILSTLIQTYRRRARTTRLNGPTSPSWLFGVTRDTFNGDFDDLFESWSKDHGTVFQIPGILGERRTVLLDAKAIHHFFAHDTYRFTSPSTVRRAIKAIVHLFCCPMLRC